MKKYILISVCASLLSCGARSSNKKSMNEKVYEKIEMSESTQKSNETHLANESRMTANKIENTEEKHENKSIDISGIENDSRKVNSENTSKSVKKTEYYKNGQKKSEMEMSENQSKLTDEKNYFKGLSEKLKESNESLIIENKVLEEDVKNKHFWNKEILDTNSELMKMYDKQKKELEKATDRKSFSGWIYLAIGFFIRVLLSVFWRWFKTTNLFLSLPKINFKNN